MNKQSLIGAKVGNFQIERLLGKGLYLAKEDFTNRQVRLKVVKKTQEYEVQKLVELATTLAALTNESIPQFYTMIEDAGYYYMALELIQGKTLHQWLAEGRKFSLNEIFQMVLALAQGLDKGHRLGVVHQNLYPKTLVLAENNIIKMSTYGLNLKIGKTGFDLEDVEKTTFEQGSELSVDEDAFYYWSPELYHDKPLDGRSDIYCLGVVFYHLLTGKYPLGETSGIAYLNKLDKEQPTPARHHNPQVPAAVDAIVARMLQPRPEERYQTAGDLAMALQEYMETRANAIRFEGKNYVAKAFVAMPFSAAFDQVFTVIEAACEENNVQAMRIDNLVDVDNIWYAILREIEDSEFIIADFSGDKYQDVPNCNVVTEAAHARAKGKPLILLSQHPEYMFFDWRTQHALKYSPEQSDWQLLRKSLGRKIQGCLRLVEKLQQEKNNQDNAVPQ